MVIIVIDLHQLYIYYDYMNIILKWCYIYFITQLIFHNMDKLAKQWHTDNDRFYLFPLLLPWYNISCLAKWYRYSRWQTVLINRNYLMMMMAMTMMNYLYSHLIMMMMDIDIQKCLPNCVPWRYVANWCSTIWLH